MYSIIGDWRRKRATGVFPPSREEIRFMGPIKKIVFGLFAAVAAATLDERVSICATKTQHRRHHG